MIPVLGQDLLTLEHEGRRLPLYRFLAERVAETLEVEGSDLPAGDELAEVARRAVVAERDSQAVYRAVRKVFRDWEPIPVPPPLAQLAAITKLKLYVTTTFDTLTERALDEARFEGQRQTLAFVYAPNDKQDLPPEFDRLSRPAVFYLMGRLSATPRSYAVTRDDVLEFTESLHSRAEDAPFFLFDKLGTSDLLFIGTHVADWLAHLFARSPDATRRVDAAAHAGETSVPVVFVERVTGATATYPGGDAAAFVRELAMRWSALEEEAEAPPPEALASTLPPGAVILSCARSDREAAEVLRETLDRAGVDVLLDEDDVALAEKWEMKLKHCVGESSAFVPVFSARSAGTHRRWTGPEWMQLLLRAQNAAAPGDGGTSFLLPLVLDDTPPAKLSLPEAFPDVERLHDGRPSEDLVKRIVKRQRDHRRASYA